MPMPDEMKPEAEDETEGMPGAPGVAKVEVEVETKPEPKKEDGGMGTPPTPTEPIPQGNMAQLCQAINDAVGYLTDGKGPQLDVGKYASGGPETSTQAPMDAEEWIALTNVATVLGILAGVDPALKKLEFAPSAITTRAGVVEVTQKLAELSRSQAAKKAMAAAEAKMVKEAGGPPAEGAEPPPPPVA